VGACRIHFGKLSRVRQDPFWQALSGVASWTHVRGFSRTPAGSILAGALGFGLSVPCEGILWEIAHGTTPPKSRGCAQRRRKILVYEI
jgi:hypothetical protein